MANTARDNADAYFNQTKVGESRWWSWLTAFWFTMVIGLVVGGFLSSPIASIVGGINPEAVQSYEDAMIAHMSSLDAIRVATLFGLCGLFTLLGGATWLIHRFTQGGVRKVFAWISGLSMVASVVSGIILYPTIVSADVNAAYLPLIGESAIAYALMLMTFPAFLVGLYLCQKFIHRRTITSLHTAAAKIDWKRILFAIALTWVVYGVLATVLHISGLSALKMNFDASKFFIFALATLIFIPLQSGTEEILFRGYLNQGIGHFISNKWVVFVITSVLFAAMHLSNPEALAGAEDGSLTHLLVMSQYFLFGFILSVVVYFEGGLEAAIGVHAGNNMFAAMFVNYEGSVLPTPSLYLATPNANLGAITIIISLTAIMYVLYRTRPHRTAAA